MSIIDNIAAGSLEAWIIQNLNQHISEFREEYHPFRIIVRPYAFTHKITKAGLSDPIYPTQYPGNVPAGWGRTFIATALQHSGVAANDELLVTFYYRVIQPDDTITYDDGIVLSYPPVANVIPFDVPIAFRGEKYHNDTEGGDYFKVQLGQGIGTVYGGDEFVTLYGIMVTMPKINGEIVLKAKANSDTQDTLAEP